MYPKVAGDAHDRVWLTDLLIPSFPTVVDDVVAGCEDTVGAPITAQELRSRRPSGPPSVKSYDQVAHHL